MHTILECTIHIILDCIMHITLHCTLRTPLPQTSLTVLMLPKGGRFVVPNQFALAHCTAMNCLELYGWNVSFFHLITQIILRLCPGFIEWSLGTKIRTWEWSVDPSKDLTDLNFGCKQHCTKVVFSKARIIIEDCTATIIVSNNGQDFCTFGIENGKLPSLFPNFGIGKVNGKFNF